MSPHLQLCSCCNTVTCFCGRKTDLCSFTKHVKKKKEKYLWLLITQQAFTEKYDALFSVFVQFSVTKSWKLWFSGKKNWFSQQIILTFTSFWVVLCVCELRKHTTLKMAASSCATFSNSLQRHVNASMGCDVIYSLWKHATTHTICWLYVCIIVFLFRDWLHLLYPAVCSFKDGWLTI